jgi:putative membrane protein
MNSSQSNNPMQNSSPNIALAGKLRVGVWVLTIAVWGLVGLMRRPEKIPLPDGVELGFLPAVNATLNSLVAIFLVIALVMIKRKNIVAHRRFISSAMITSAVFLLSYVAYHFTTAETKFGGEGTIRTVYFVLLISHIVLAAVSLPFILQTWVYAFTSQFDKHRKMARWVFPMWLYVAITGPICYLMLRPYY